MLADQMRRLAEEIANAYEERVQGVAELKENTAGMLNDFKDQHSEMTQELRTALKAFTASLDAAEVDRKNATQADLKAMGDQIRADLEQFVTDLDAAEVDRKNTMQADLKAMADQLQADLAKIKPALAAEDAERKTMTQADLKAMRDQIRADLKQFITDLDAAEVDRKNTMLADLKTMAEQLRADLAKIKPALAAEDAERREIADQFKERLVSFRTDLSATVSTFLGEFKSDRMEAAKAWNDILSAIRTAGGTMTITSPVEVETAVEVGTVEEAIEEEKETEEAWPEEEPEAVEEEEEEEIPDSEDLNAEILSLLEDTPEGLRMVEIAETVDVENWRSLIPVMRELLDLGEVRKEDSTYYIA